VLLLLEVDTLLRLRENKLPFCSINRIEYFQSIKILFTTFGELYLKEKNITI
jgi:hypothetical protein